MSDGAATTGQAGTAAARGVGARPRGVRSRLGEAVATCRSAVWLVAGLSVVINILMLAPPIYMLQIYNRVLGTGRIETLVLLTLMVAGALAVLGALEALRSVVGARVGSWLERSLGPAFLGLGIEAGAQGRRDGAQSLRDLATLRGFISSSALGIFFDFPWVPIYVLVIALLHPVLGLLAAASALVIGALAVANELMTRSDRSDASDRASDANREVEAAMRNAETVRAMGMTGALIARWRSVNDTASAATGRAAERSGILLGLVKFVRAFVQVAILGLGAYLAVRGELTPGAMIAASILLGRALAPVEQSVGAWRQFQNARIAWRRLKRHDRQWEGESRTRLPEPIGVIEVHNATVIPSRSRVPILREVAFDARPGEALAVIGPSASGKSTLCRLLIGILAPSFGEVRLDGSSLAHFDRDQLGAAVGYLPQDTELFAGTVRENIARMGVPDDTAVVRAAQLACAHEMIQLLPDGYDTAIGEGGLGLSGGQRQRIGLARAVYGAPKVIVLDEPNSNLDQRGEAALSAAIKSLKENGSTLVIVGHRPSTLAEADRVLLLENGRVRMVGPRDEIIARLRGQALERSGQSHGEEADPDHRVAAVREAPKGTASPGAPDLPSIEGAVRAASGTRPVPLRRLSGLPGATRGIEP